MTFYHLEEGIKMRLKRETVVKSTKSLYTGTGAAGVAALVVGHFAPELTPGESASAIAVLAGGMGTVWRLIVGILETRFGLAKYL